MHILLLLPLFAQAAAPIKYCQPISLIERKLELCDDNVKFAEAAEKCVKAFKAHVDTERASLKRVLESGGNSPTDQNNSEAVSAAAYSEAILKISALIAEGVASRIESKNYISHFIWPFHWTSEMGPVPKKDDPILAKTFDGEYCYGEHRETIDHMLGDFSKMIGDLTQTKSELFALKKKAEERNKDLGAGSTQKSVSATKGKSAAGGASSKQESDITGTDESAKKARK